MLHKSLGRLYRVTSQMSNVSRSIPRRGHNISTAACLVIGDEVLGGKVHEGNAHFFSKYCTRNGISLKRIEIIPDEESDIIEAVQRMSNNYDLVVTSGGIGPTHDDITYASIAKAFNLPLVVEEESFKRIKESKQTVDWDAKSAKREALMKMVTLPLDLKRQIMNEQVFFKDDLWTPICVVNENVHILPGVHSLFMSMLDAYEPVLRTKLAKPAQKLYRVVIDTPLTESEVAESLEELAAQVKSHDIKVGSYPNPNREKNNTVDLVGTDKEYLETLVPEVEKRVNGKLLFFHGRDGDEEKVEK